MAFGSVYDFTLSGWRFDDEIEYLLWREKGKWVFFRLNCKKFDLVGLSADMLLYFGEI